MTKLVHLTLTLSLTLFFGANLASAIPGRAEVKLVGESATVTKATGASSPLAVGMVLGTGDTVTTGKGSSVALWLGINGETLLVGANTTLNLEELEITSVEDGIVKTTVNVTKGKVVGVVQKKLAAASKFEIKTPKGVARIRGTQYAFADDGTLIVLEGTVTYTYLENGQPKSVVVSQGQQFKQGDAAPTTYVGTFEMNPDVLAAFVEVLNSSGIDTSTSSSSTAVLNALSSLLDISAGQLKAQLIAAGVARESAPPEGIINQPLNTIVVSPSQ